MSKKTYGSRSDNKNEKKARKEFQPRLFDQKRPVIEKPLFLMALIIILTFIAFFPSLKNEFITTWDDSAYVINNPVIHSLNQASLKEMFTNSVASSYVPLPLLSYSLEYKFFGLNPLIFHLTNLLLHLLCTLLVFKILRMLKLNPVYAAIGALLFGVHPMHVESVAWVSERKDLLFSLFCLASIRAYITYVNTQKKKLLFILLSFILFIMALFSKITAVTLPVSLLLIDYYLERPFKGKVLIEKIPFFILSLVFGIAEIIMFQHQGTFKTTEIISVADQVFMGFYALSAYILKFFTPFQLSAIYPWQIAPGHALPFLFYISPLFIVFLGFLIYRATRKNRAILFGSLFFLVNIILMFQAQILTGGGGFLADRFAYLPYLGICFIAGWTAELVIRNKKELKQLVLGVMFLVILIFTGISYSRNRSWNNDFTLWNDVIEKYPGEIYKSYANRGLAFTALGRWDDAISDFTRVIEMNPKYGWGYTDRGVAYQNTNQWDKSVDDFSKAIEIDSNNLDAYADRGVSYGVLGRLDKAIADFTRTIRINPTYAKGYSNRGVTYTNLGFPDKAIADYTKAIKIDPGFRDAYSNRSVAYGKLKQWDNAIADGVKSVKLDPHNAGMYDKLGYYYLGVGDLVNAEDQFRKSINIDVTNFDPYLGLALIYYSNGYKADAKTTLDQAKNLESRLKNGMEGINELEKMGYLKPDNTKEILRKMFSELK